MNPTTILLALRKAGVCKLPAMTDTEYRVLVAALGRPWAETVVALRPDVRTYLCQADAVPFHTDHPDADLMSWRCERPDANDGAQLLLDGWAVLDACGASVRESLRHAHLQVRERGGSPPSRVPVLRTTDLGDRLLFAPWLRPTDTDPRSTGAFDALCREVVAASSTQHLSVTLAEGEVLIIDNGRMLHGRGPLPPGSERLLRRFWITAT